MTVQITILGLGQIGASIGLALAAQKGNILRVGNDREPLVARHAEKLGAVDRLEYNLPRAVKDADVVILALAMDEVRETLEFIAPDLKPGAVVVDTSPVKVAVEAWAAQYIPEDRHFVSMTPTLNPKYLEEAGHGVEAAHADLFNESVMIITTPPGGDGGAFQLVSDLTALLGARPYFCDAAEADGLLASSRLLPQLLSFALLDAITGQPGWQETRKVAGQSFAGATQAVMDVEGRTNLAELALLNGENAVRLLGDLIASLQTLRQQIAGSEGEALHSRFQDLQNERILWLDRRQKFDWETSAQSEPLPTAGEIMGRLLGLGRRPKSKENR